MDAQILTMAAPQFGKQRRTSRKRSLTQLARGRRETGICRISTGPAWGYTRHHSINFIVCSRSASLGQPIQVVCVCATRSIWKKAVREGSSKSGRLLCLLAIRNVASQDGKLG
jgi:hypothetical protein